MTRRILPPAEWGRLVGTLHEHAIQFLDPATTQLLVVEDGDRIVGSVAVLLQPHVEGVTIDTAYRQRVSVGRHLLQGVRDLVGDREVLVMAVGESGRRLIAGLGTVVHLDCDHYAVRI